MSLPRVTVVMSAYNSEATIAEAVESILVQTFKDFVFVVYDDASTDGSCAILRRYGDPRLDVRVLAKNRGLSANLAEGVVGAESDYIARMDADDIALPERLAEQVAHLDAHLEIDVLGTNVIFFDDHGHEFLGVQPGDHEAIALTLFFGFTMMHPTIMMRTAALRRSGSNYDPQFTYSQDFDLWSRMLPAHRFANLQRPLLKMREHPRKISRTKRSTQQMFTNEIRARQVSRVLPDATQEELAIFCAATRGDGVGGVRELAHLEKFLCRLIDANRQVSAFPPAGFARAAALLFRSVCRTLLIANDPTGALYWRSPLRRMGPPMTPREWTVMAGRSARAMLARSDSVRSAP